MATAARALDPRMDNSLVCPVCQLRVSAQLQLGLPRPHLLPHHPGPLPWLHLFPRGTPLTPSLQSPTAHQLVSPLHRRTFLLVRTPTDILLVRREPDQHQP